METEAKKNEKWISGKNGKLKLFFNFRYRPNQHWRIIVISFLILFLATVSAHIALLLGAVRSEDTKDPVQEKITIDRENLREIEQTLDKKRQKFEEVSSSANFLPDPSL